jgi:hypothetical protein
LNEKSYIALILIPVAMVSLKSAIIFFVGFVVFHIVTYYIAGIIAQVGLGAGQYYPPSANAISFLAPIPSQLLIIPAQSLRGFFLLLLFFRLEGE